MLLVDIAIHFTILLLLSVLLHSSKYRFGFDLDLCGVCICTFTMTPGWKGLRSMYGYLHHSRESEQMAWFCSMVNFWWGNLFVVISALKPSFVWSILFFLFLYFGSITTNVCACLNINKWNQTDYGALCSWKNLWKYDGGKAHHRGCKYIHRFWRRVFDGRCYMKL